MKIQVAKQDLEGALQVVNASLGSGSADDISAHYVFRAKQIDGQWKAEVLTYTGRLCAGAPFVAKVEGVDDGEENMAFTIDGWRLKDLMKLIPEGVLEFEFEGAETVYTGPGSTKGTLRYQSLNPAKYPFWDQGFEDAESVATVPAATLKRAFNLARLFVMGKDEETKRPDLTVFEARKGFLQATNTKTVVLVELPELTKSTLRVHRDDASKLVSFLDTAGDGEVEIHESDQALYLQRGDGAVLGEYKFNVRFPDNLKVSKIEEDPHWIEFEVEAFKTAIGYLLTAAGRDDNRIRIKPGQKDIVVSMELASKDGDARETIPLLGSGSKADANPLSDSGFLLDRNELKQFFSVYTEDNLRLGLHSRGKSGFSRVFFAEEGLGCQIILAWLRE